MTTARRKDRVQHISGEELPAEVWLIVYMHGGIDGKHARRLAHACRQMCAAASAHEDNTILAQVQERSTVSLTGLFGDSDSDEE